jgi:DNA-binding MarR family transcriptional regulator
MIRRLTERAVALFAQERALAGDADNRCIEPLPLAPGRPRHTLLAAELMTLLVYLQRSGALSYKRLIGLSSFDWQVLSQVAEHTPLPLAQLILMLGRDKGQAGRTVKRLEELQLIERRRSSGRRAVLLHPTPRGKSIYAAMAEHGLERNAFLTAGIEPDELSRFLATLDRLTANAELMLGDALPKAAGGSSSRPRTSR